ncbi:unnamed protein product, partial [Effrenium voratum]
EVDDYLAVHGQTRFQRLRSAAGEACSCNEAWRAQAEQALQRNGVALQTFFFDVLRLLRDGRREDVPVMVLMGRFGGEGKSFLLSHLRSMFEHVQATPQRGSFPLLGLEKKKVVLMDDWCFDNREKDLGPIIDQAQLALMQGKPSEHTMLLRRLRIYNFTQPFPALRGHKQHISERP